MVLHMREEARATNPIRKCRQAVLSGADRCDASGNQRPGPIHDGPAASGNNAPTASERPIVAEESPSRSSGLSRTRSPEGRIGRPQGRVPVARTTDVFSLILPFSASRSTTSRISSSSLARWF